MFLKRLRCRPIISFYNGRGRTSVIHNHHNSSINLLEPWTNGRNTFSTRSASGTADRRHQDPPAIAGNLVANYGIPATGISGNPVVGYVLPAIPLSTIPLPAMVEISPNTRDRCMFR
jgi:hypothetical protein